MSSENVTKKHYLTGDSQHLKGVKNLSEFGWIENRILSKAVVYPFLDIFKTCMDKTLGNLI